MVSRGFLNVATLAELLAPFASLKELYDFLVSHMAGRVWSPSAPRLYAYKKVWPAKILFEAWVSGNQSYGFVTIAGYMQGAFMPRLFPLSLHHETKT
jgi:hypothetical protein